MKTLRRHQFAYASNPAPNFKDHIILSYTIIATLQPGNYTAIVRGINNSTGVALVEVYDLH